VIKQKVDSVPTFNMLESSNQLILQIIVDYLAFEDIKKLITLNKKLHQIVPPIVQQEYKRIRTFQATLQDTRENKSNLLASTKQEVNKIKLEIKFLEEFMRRFQTYSNFDQQFVQPMFPPFNLVYIRMILAKNINVKSHLSMVSTFQSASKIVTNGV
jgi:hypothetical protein